MKSSAIVSKGSVSACIVMGYNGGLGCVVRGLVAWQVAHPFTKFAMSVLMVGHQ